MFRETLAQIKTISNFSPVPIRAERAMMSRLMSNVKLCRRTLTRNLLDTLLKYKIGTREVDQIVKRVYKNRLNWRKQYKLTTFIMKEKLEDSKYEVIKARDEYNKATAEYRSQIQPKTVTDILFTNIMKRETEKTWTIGKKKNCKKVNTLTQRSKDSLQKERHNTKRDTKTVKYKDHEIQYTNRNKF